MGPTWVLSAPNGPHLGPMNLAIRDVLLSVNTMPAESSTRFGTGVIRSIWFGQFSIFVIVIPQVFGQLHDSSGVNEMYLSPFLQSTLIPAWISKCIHYKVWDEITYPFLNFNGVTIEVLEWTINFIPHFIMVWSYIHAEITKQTLQKSRNVFYIWTILCCNKTDTHGNNKRTNDHSRRA